MRGNIITHEREDHRHRMLCRADAVAIGDLGDRNPALHRRPKIYMVGADAGSNCELEILCLSDSLGIEVGRPEWLRDHDFRVRQLALEN